jgi:starvation-inducible outer membrane lipoprotein
MRKPLFVLLFGLAVLLSACPAQPPDTAGTWNQSTWDAATWK